MLKSQEQVWGWNMCKTKTSRQKQAEPSPEHGSWPTEFTVKVVTDMTGKWGPQRKLFIQRRWKSAGHVSALWGPPGLLQTTSGR